MVAIFPPYKNRVGHAGKYKYGYLTAVFTGNPVLLFAG